MNTGPDSSTIENFKILRTIWKNSFDKILEIKVIVNFLNKGW